MKQIHIKKLPELEFFSNEYEALQILTVIRYKKKFTLLFVFLHVWQR